MCTTNDLVFSKEAVEPYIDKKNKLRRGTTNVSRSKEKSAALTMRLQCINCGEDHPLDSCLRFMAWLWGSESTSYQTKVTLFNICNQWINNLMKRNVMKGWTVEPIVVVVQQVYMVMCQKVKMLLKRVKRAVK